MYTSIRLMFRKDRQSIDGCTCIYLSICVCPVFREKKNKNIMVINKRSAN